MIEVQCVVCGVELNEKFNVIYNAGVHGVACSPECSRTYYMAQAILAGGKQ